MHGGTVLADPEPDSGLFRLFSFSHTDLSNVLISWRLDSCLISLQTEEFALTLCFPANIHSLTAFLLLPATAEDSLLSSHRRYWRLACPGTEYSHLFDYAFPCLGECLTMARSTSLIGMDARFSSACWPQSIDSRCLKRDPELVVSTSGVGRCRMVWRRHKLLRSFFFGK